MKGQLQRLEEEYKQVDGNVSDFGNNTLMEWKALCKGWSEAFAECREVSNYFFPAIEAGVTPEMNLSYPLHTGQ